MVLLAKGSLSIGISVEKVEIGIRIALEIVILYLILLTWTLFNLVLGSIMAPIYTRVDHIITPNDLPLVY